MEKFSFTLRFAPSNGIFTTQIFPPSGDPLGSSRQRARAELRTVIFHIFYGLNEWGKISVRVVLFFLCVSENNRNMECDSDWEKDGKICVQIIFLLSFLPYFIRNFIHFFYKFRRINLVIITRNC